MMLLKALSKTMSKRLSITPKQPSNLSKTSSKTLPSTMPKTDLTLNPIRNVSHLQNLTPLGQIAYRDALAIKIVLEKKGIAIKRIAPPIQAARYLEFPVRIADAGQSKEVESPKITEALAYQAGTTAVHVRRDRGMTMIEFDKPEVHWDMYTRRQVTGLGIGLVNQNNQVDVTFDDDNSQIAVIGTTGSGKSELIKSIMLAVMGSYSPDQVQFAIIDPHSDYDQFDNAAHLLHPIAQEMGDIEKLLIALEQIYDHRRANNIRNAHKIIVIADELTEMVTAIEGAWAIVEKLANGRKYNINVVGGLHEATKDNMPSKGKFTNRFVGKLATAQESVYATTLAGVEAHKLTGKGDFFHVKNAMPIRFQAAIATHGDFELLERKEVRPVIFTQPNEIVYAEAVDMVEHKPAGGRPQTTLDMAHLAAYIAANANGKAISINQADSLFGLKRTGHNLTKQAAAELLQRLEMDHGLYIYGGE